MIICQKFVLIVLLDRAFCENDGRNVRENFLSMISLELPSVSFIHGSHTVNKVRKFWITYEYFAWFWSLWSLYVWDEEKCFLVWKGEQLKISVAEVILLNDPTMYRACKEVHVGVFFFANIIFYSILSL